MGFGKHALSPAELAAMLEAERRGAAFIAYRDDAHELRIHSLGAAREITIGRAPENDVALGWDPEISRTHAQLELVGGDWTLRDDGLSRNGTFVNGERVTSRRRLEDRDTLRIGHCTLLFRSPFAIADSTVAAERGPAVRLTEAERRVLVAMCRPLLDPDGSGVPASNREIAEELHLTVSGVKTQVRSLFAKLGIDDLPQYRKRVELVRRALESGVVGPQR